MRARELMSSPVVTVRPEATLKEVAELMATHHISGLPVVDRFGSLVGVISEADFLTRMKYAGPDQGPRGLLDRLARTAGSDLEAKGQDRARARDEARDYRRAGRDRAGAGPPDAGPRR
jgi:CBS domain-containing protein